MNVVSLFSGAGGMDLGFIQAGCQVVWANDSDKYASQVYSANIGDIFTGDIRKVSTDIIPFADILCAGFPCQPFSSAGSRKGILDERGNLFLECLRVIDHMQPKVVVFENVKGILTTKNDDGSLLIDTISFLLDTSGIGYDVNIQTLKASDYNVPQKRDRVFFIAFRKDLNIHYRFPEPVQIPFSDLTVGKVTDIHMSLPNQDEILPFSPQTIPLIPYIKEGGSWKDIPYEVLPDRLKKIRDNMKKYHSPNFFRRFARNEINGTITATATPEKCGIIHPTIDRRYSVREVARFQSFPDSFYFPGSSLASKYRVIGNAVPPTLAKHIALSIMDALT